MENKNRNADYQIFVRVGIFTIFYTGSFQILPEKSPPLKCQFPPKIYKRSEKWPNPTTSPPQSSPFRPEMGWGGEGCELWIYEYHLF